MGALRISEIIVNSDSEDSDLDYDVDLDHDFDSQTSDLETDSDDDTVQAASDTTAKRAAFLSVVYLVSENIPKTKLHKSAFIY